MGICIVNELRRLSGVQSKTDDKMIISMLRINQSVMRNIPTSPIPRDVQEEAQEESQDQLYHPEIQQSEEDPQQQQAPDRLQSLEEHTLGMASWPTENSPN